MNLAVKNILIVGVGGQGILLASEVLSELLMLAGYDVKKSEIHGMSQRGGSVVSHVRFGSKVYSPVIPEGEGDILLGFEIMESCRFLNLLRGDARVVTSDFQIPPPSILLGQDKYPQNADKIILSRYPDSKIINVMNIAEQSGDPRTANTVLLGAVSVILDIDESIWDKALENMLPSKILEVNKKAFAAGRAL